MKNLTPKIDDALSAVIELLGLEPNFASKSSDGTYKTQWGNKTAQGLKLSIINKLREYGVVLSEDENL